MRRYRPFLIYNPAKGWAFYPNHQVTNFTHKSIGDPRGRKVMRKPVGWFVNAQFAAMMEHQARSIVGAS